MAFELNKEKALDVLIWWVESTDGSIDYTEKQTVKEVLDEMNYSLETFYQETVLHIGALGTEELNVLIGKAIEWASKNYSIHEKKKALALLQVIADSDSDGEMSDEQREKLNKIRRAFGLKGE